MELLAGGRHPAPGVLAVHDDGPSLVNLWDC